MPRKPGSQVDPFDREIELVFDPGPRHSRRQEDYE